jgi:integrase
MAVYRKKRKDSTLAWFYDFSFKGIRYRGVGGSTRTHALRVLDKIRNQVYSGEFDLVTNISDPKIDDFAIRYLKCTQHLRSHRRIALSVKTLLSFLKGYNLSSINPYLIEEYVIKRRNDGVANATINRELTTLKRMFNLAIKWKESKANPVNELDFLEEPPGRDRFLYEPEAQNLIDAAPLHIKPIIITALNTGMRSGEIFSLLWDQVHLDSVINPFIEISHSKNNKKRYIPLNNDMVELLRSLPKKSDNYVFHGRYGNPIKGIKGPWKNALIKTGISNFRFHDLRHTFASHFVMKGGDILTLKEILGHSSLKMVERYAHLGTSTKAYK